MLLTIFSMVVEYKPLLFFSILTVLFAGVGVILFIQILVEFSLTQLVPRMPTLFVAFGLMMMGLMSFFTGLTMTKIRKNTANYLRLILIYYAKNNELY